MLQDTDRQKLDSIVTQMSSKGASQQEVQNVVNDFKSKYDKPIKSPSISSVNAPVKTQTFAEEQASIQLPSEKIRQAVTGDNNSFGSRFLGNLVSAPFKMGVDPAVKLWKSVAAAEGQAETGLRNLTQGLKEGSTIKTGSGFANMITSPITALTGIPGSGFVTEPLEPLMGAIDTAFRISGKLSGQNPYSEEYQQGVIDPTMGALMTMLAAAGGKFKGTDLTKLDSSGLSKFTTDLTKTLLKDEKLPKNGIKIIKNESTSPKQLTPGAEQAANAILKAPLSEMLWSEKNMQPLPQAQELFNIIGKNKVKPTWNGLKQAIIDEIGISQENAKLIRNPYKDLPSTAPIKPLMDALSEIMKYPEMALVKNKKGLTVNSPLVEKIQNMIDIQKEYYSKEKPTIGQDQLRKQGLYSEFKKVFQGGEVNLPEGSKLIIDKIAQGLKEGVEDSIKDPVARQALIDANRRYGNLSDILEWISKESGKSKQAIPQTSWEKIKEFGPFRTAAIAARMKGIPLPFQGAEAAITVQAALSRLFKLIKKEYKNAPIQPSTLGKPGTAVGTGNIMDIVKRYSEPVNLKPQVPLLPAKTSIPSTIPMGPITRMLLDNYIGKGTPKR